MDLMHRAAVSLNRGVFERRGRWNNRILNFWSQEEDESSSVDMFNLTVLLFSFPFATLLTFNAKSVE